MMMRKEQRKMGLTHVQVTVRNPADAERSWAGAFLVDTGAIDSLVPRERLEQIGLKPKGRRVYGFADGREAAMDITVAELEFMGEIIGSTVVFGKEGSEPLLGVTALESMGIEIDPVSQRLRKLPSIHLKASKGRDSWTVFRSCRRAARFGRGAPQRRPFGAGPRRRLPLCRSQGEVPSR